MQEKSGAYRVQPCSDMPRVCLFCVYSDEQKPLQHKRNVNFYPLGLTKSLGWAIIEVSFTT